MSYLGPAIATVLAATLGAVLSQGGEPADTNYDESNVPRYELPDPLVCFDGRTVTDPKMWRETRRPEILRAFEANSCGRTPQVATRPRFEATETDAKALGEVATRKQVAIRLSEAEGAPWTDLLLYIPNNASRPVPAFLGLSYGNQGVHPDPGIKPSRDTTPKRGAHAARWPLEIMKRGYAVATFAGADVEQDRHGSGSLMKPDSWREGVRGYLLAKPGRAELADDEWGSTGVWAWGLSRAMDYLETGAATDRKKVAALGHSRTGKPEAPPR